MENNTLKIINLQKVDSTNEYALKLAEAGEKEIILIRAKEQLQGRGRQGNFWHSPANKGIYASFLLRPDNPLGQIKLLPLIFSLGVINIFPKDITAQIKFPNDVLVNRKKIAGILVEARSSGERTEFVIAGIGININSGQKEIPLEATSLFLETKKTYDIDTIFKQLVNQTLGLYKEFKSGNIKNLMDKTSQFLPEASKLNLMNNSIVLR